MHLAGQPHLAVGAKQEVNRHWLTAGAVVASAAMIAAAPGISPVPAGVQSDLQAAAVRLTAGWDPLAPWQAAFDTAVANGTILGDNFLLAPGVGLQQAIANQIGYAKQLFDDPSSFEAVSQQFSANVMKVITGLTLIGADEATTDTVLKHTLGGLHGLSLGFFPSFLADGVDVETFSAVMNVLASPLSGVLIGMAGPALSPAVALANSATAISDALQAGDPTTALTGLLGIPAGMVDAFLNGADLNLDALAPLINDAGLIKDAVKIDGITLALGGLLTPGSTDRSPYEVKDEDGNVIKTIEPVGGSIFNSLGLDVNLGGTSLAVEGEAVGPIGALQGLSQTVGVLLGSGWDDWDGKGKAPAPKPPLFGLDPLTAGDIFSDTAEGAGLTKLRAALKSAVAGNIAKTLGLPADTAEAADAAAAPVTDAAEAKTATVAAATELTHVTANKSVTVSVEKPEAATESAHTSDTAETAATADDSAGKTTPTAQTRPQAPDKAPRSNLVKGVRDAVKNVRNGLGANNSSKPAESATGSSSSSSGTGSAKAKPAKKDTGSKKTKHDKK